MGQFSLPTVQLQAQSPIKDTGPLIPEIPVLQSSLQIPQICENR